jgi:hypothetical protein
MKAWIPRSSRSARSDLNSYWCFLLARRFSDEPLFLNGGLEQSGVITQAGVKKRNQSGTDYVLGFTHQIVRDDGDVGASED